MKYFKTKAECLQHLQSIVEQGLLKESPTTPDLFYRPGTYYLHHGEYERPGTDYLHHGEYARPDYVPRRYKKGWAVCRRTYYYKGTLNTPPAATPCELVMVEDQHGQKYLECLWED